MENLLEHRVIRWFLTIIVFIASFHATWRTLQYVNRAPKPTPSLEYPTPIPEVPVQESPAILVQERASLC